ncbi:MAG: hypothetical protein AB1714_11080 [Acidobacteriota bacterium]
MRRATPAAGFAATAAEPSKGWMSGRAGGTEGRTASRSRRVVEGLGANCIKFAVNAAIRLLATPFYLARLGRELLGFNSFVRETLNYLQLMQLGLGPSVAAIVAKELQPGASEEQRQAVRRKARAGGQAQQVLALLALLLSVGLSLFVERLAQGLPRDALFMAKVCTVAFGVELALYLSSGVFSGLLVGRQLIGQNTLYASASAFLSAAVGVSLVALGWSLYGLAAAAIFSGAFLFLQLRWRALRAGITLDLLRGPVEWQAMGEVISLSGWMAMATVGALLSFQSSRVILGMIPGMGMSAVNQFSLLVAVPTLLRGQASQIAVQLRPGLTQLVHRGADERSKAVARLLLRVMGMTSAVAFVGTWYLNGPFVTRWVGAEYYAGEKANLLVATLTAGAIWLFGFTVLLEVRFQFQRRGAILLAAGLVTVILSVLLAPTWGIQGVLAAAIAGELLVALPFAAAPSLAWLSPGNGMLSTAFSLVSVPCLMLSAAWGLSRLGIPRPESWADLVLGGAAIAGGGAVLGTAWLGRDLWRYRPWQRNRPHGAA